MNPNYILFKSFSTKDEAEYCSLLFKENGIDFEIGDNISQVEIFVGESSNNAYEIRLKEEDFEKAQDLLNIEAERVIDAIDNDHYMYQFTKQELLEVIQNPIEWNEIDVALAKKILNDQGIQIDRKQIEENKTKQIQELAKEEPRQKNTIKNGYRLAILGGLGGLYRGYDLWKSKKTLPNGKTVYTYQEIDRKHGKNIFIISLITTPLFLGIIVYIKVKQFK